MHLALTDEQQGLQDRLRAYFTGLVEEESRNDDPEPSYTRLIRRMGHDGWLGLGWPVEFGGQGRGPVDQMIFVEESHWAGVPLPLLTLNSVGPTSDGAGHRRAEGPASCPASSKVRSTSPSATPRPRPEPIWPRCVPGRSATGTST